jgi:hypothetical protein
VLCNAYFIGNEPGTDKRIMTRAVLSATATAATPAAAAAAATPATAASLAVAGDAATEEHTTSKKTDNCYPQTAANAFVSSSACWHSIATIIA